MCLLVICLIVRDLGTKSTTSLSVVVSPEKVLVLGASLPLIIRPKCRNCNLSSSVSVRGCHAFPATPTSPSLDISGAVSWPDIAQPFIFAPILEKASSTACCSLWAEAMSFRLSLRLSTNLESVRNAASSGSSGLTCRLAVPCLPQRPGLSIRCRISVFL